MRSVQILQYGGPEVAVLQETPLPKLNSDEVLVRVAAVGVTPADWKVREGQLSQWLPNQFPMTIGTELAGRVVEIGSTVRDFVVGDQIFGVATLVGAFADFAAVKGNMIARRSAHLSAIEAAALPVGILTASSALDEGEVGLGTRILIHAAAGGVGHIAVQMAKARGAEVTAIASRQNIAFVTGLGADVVWDRSAPYENCGGAFDVVLDLYGAEAQHRSWGLIKPGGLLLSLTVPPSEQEAERHKVRAKMLYGDPDGQRLAAANALIETGQLRPTIARVFPIEDFKSAMAEVQLGKVRGRIVMTL